MSNATQAGMEDRRTAELRKSDGNKPTFVRKCIKEGFLRGSDNKGIVLFPVKKSEQ